MKFIMIMGIYDVEGNPILSCGKLYMKKKAIRLDKKLVRGDYLFIFLDL